MPNSWAASGKWRSSCTRDLEKAALQEKRWRFNADGRASALTIHNGSRFHEHYSSTGRQEALSGNLAIRQLRYALPYYTR